jgi:tripartite-type tricarboxylate transporter receptor subunit TctC
MRTTSRAALLGLALLAAPAAARAEDYPARPVTVVSPYAAGGGIDLLARLLASRLEQRLGRPFVIENKAGAATAIAATSVAHAPPDGYTILLATSTTMAINVSMAKHLAYDPARELAPIALVTQSPFVLCARCPS